LQSSFFEDLYETYNKFLKFITSRIKYNIHPSNTKSCHSAYQSYGTILATSGRETPVHCYALFYFWRYKTKIVI